jgi:hypothetical protein
MLPSASSRGEAPGQTATVKHEIPSGSASGLAGALRAAFALGAAVLVSADTAASGVVAAVSAGTSDALEAGGILGLIRTALSADSMFSGPGGAGPGAWVLVALGLFVAYRAWMRRNGLENDVAPAAPVLSTDVSPD